MVRVNPSSFIVKRRTAPSGAGDGDSFGQRLILLSVDKLLLGIAAATVILVLQKRVERAEARHEKARQVAFVAVDRPLAIASQLAPHFDKFVAYATNVRAANVVADSQRLNEMQEDIHADLEGARAFYGTDSYLLALSSKIRDVIAYVKAAELATHTLTPEDIRVMEETRLLCHEFHQRIIRDSIQRVGENVDDAYSR